MKRLKSDWCSEGKCPCPVKRFMQQTRRCMNLSELSQEVGESELKVMNCLGNMLIRDNVCKDGNLWCPDNL